METAKAFGLTPAQWRAQSPDDRARMIAHEMLKGWREAYQGEQIKKKAERSAKSPDGKGGRGPTGRTGFNAYEAQKAAMRSRLAK